MNISHNKCLITSICFAALLAATGSVSACKTINDPSVFQKQAAKSIKQWQNDEVKVCGKALSGEMTVDIYKQLSTNISDEKILECALGDYIAEPFYTQTYYDKVWEVKKQLAELLFTKELDVSYTDDSGRGFARYIVSSPHSEEWRIKMLKIFKEKGGDLFKRNEYNRNPLDIARFSEDTKIVAYLESIDEK